MARRSEFDLIAALRAALPAPGPRVEVGSGDDAAVVRAGGAASVVSVDTTVDGVHARLDLGDPREAAAAFGWRGLTTALSDLAAMGVPAGEAYVALTLPDGMEDDLVLALAGGMAEAAAAYGCSVVGGDVSAGPVAALSVTVVGWAGAAETTCAAGARSTSDDAAQEDRAAGARSASEDAAQATSAAGATRAAVLTRGGTRPGDLVGVTGPIGAAGAGLALVLGQVDRAELPEQDAAAAERAYLRPIPHLIAGAALLAAGATAAIDLSDGLLADAGHVARASGAAYAADPEANTAGPAAPGRALELRLDSEAIPLAPAATAVALQLGLDPVRFATTAGEDFVLLVTVPAAHRAAAEAAGVVAWIGDVHELAATAGASGLVTLDGAPPDPGRAGHDHRA